MRLITSYLRKMFLLVIWKVVGDNGRYLGEIVIGYASNFRYRVGGGRKK